MLYHKRYVYKATNSTPPMVCHEGYNARAVMASCWYYCYISTKLCRVDLANADVTTLKLCCTYKITTTEGSAITLTLDSKPTFHRYLWLQGHSVGLLLCQTSTRPSPLLQLLWHTEIAFSHMYQKSLKAFSHS